jgi:esterase/lipase superfamily enzyme
VNRTYHKWFSNHLNRDMELLVFGHAGAKVLVFPTRQGRFYDYENWGHGECLAALNYIRLYCVDGVDSESLYCHCAPPAVRVRRHQQYERYLLEEVIPLMRAENGSPSLVAHGCSIGAYHAMNLALRYPWLFRKVVALSGRYDLTRSFGPFTDLFNGHYDQDIYFITPNHFLPNLHDPSFLEPIRRMEITLAVGDTTRFMRAIVCLATRCATNEFLINLPSGRATRTAPGTGVKSRRTTYSPCQVMAGGTSSWV